MLRNKKPKKITKPEERRELTDKRRALNTIDENNTIKISRNDQLPVSSSQVEDRLEEMFSSEENIPASQEPTQRYLSQRSNFTTLGRTQSNMRSGISMRPPNTYFELVLMKAGVQLDAPDIFILSCDHVTFVNKFRELFTKAQNYPDNIATFCTGLRDALSARSELTQKLLTGCTISIPGEESVYQSQESMLVNLLMLDFLCGAVLEVLLEKIEQIASSDTIVTTTDNMPLLPLLLAQLRYVAHTQGTKIYERIKKCFEKASATAKYDIIASAEFILESHYHDRFAQLLLDNLTGLNEFFTTTVIQTMTNLCLSYHMQAKLRMKILNFIREGDCSNLMLIVLTKFLFKVLNEDNDECVRELVEVLREILMLREYTQESKQAQMDLFNLISQGVARSKKFYSIWQKTLASLPPQRFGACDFIMILLLIRVKEDNFLYLENILRRRIKLEHITVDILTEVKRKFHPILELHTEQLMQLLTDFLREKHKAVADFARASYSVLFSVGLSLQKEIIQKLLELNFDKSSPNLTHLALEMLLDLKTKYPKEMHNWGTMLMPLLDRLSEMSLSQTRLVMELLCAIAYPPPEMTECSTLQDQIDMLMTKQLINRDDFIKKQGIVGSVQLVDNIARIEEHDILLDSCNTTFSSVCSLPDGRGKIAAEYVVRIQSSTGKCSQLLALFYDELASVCTSSTNELNMDIPFLIWLCELMTYYFQNNFVAEHTPNAVHGIELTYQKCINSNSDINTESSELPSIAINIAEYVFNPPDDAGSSIDVLAPLFNLVRALHLLRYEKSLELINALLGCAIILPEFFDEADPDKIFTNYDGRVQRQILDIYFHCDNWIRETISSFATQREPMIQKKVLQRLADLIDIESKIQNLLMYAPNNYTPPVCNFVAAKSNAQPSGTRGRPAAGAKPQKANRGRQKVMANQTETELLVHNETNANETTLIGANMSKKAGKTSGKTKRNFDILYGPKENYRQMGSELMLLLETKLLVEYPLPISEIGAKIGLLEFRFILTDLVGKLESITGVERFHSEQVLQHIAKPHYFMQDLSQFLGTIFLNMEMIGAAIGNKLIEIDHIYSHADLFTDAISYLKVCFELCFRLFAGFFSWSEFANESRNDLLKSSLIALLLPPNRHKVVDKGSAGRAAELFDCCFKYESAIIDLKTAMHLYHLVVTLKRHASNSRDGKIVLEQRDQEIRTLCKTLLCRKWFGYDATLEKGAACNTYLDELVRGFLRNSNFNRQREILNIVLEECKRFNGKDASLKSFPNIKKANFPLLFRGLCEILTSQLQDEINSESASLKEDKLKIWEASCDLLNTLLDIMKAVDLPRNFQLFVKHSHIYLKLVLQHGLIVFEEHLRRNTDRVCHIIKNLQATTRFLHNICCQSKASKNNIISQIPLIRETVETLVFRVKAVLAANKCSAVFWMGNLKNKDLHGEVILSQTVSLNVDDQADSDEEIPDDDISVDETICGQDGVLSRKSSNGLTSTDSEGSKSRSRSKCL